MGLGRKLPFTSFPSLLLRSIDGLRNPRKRNAHVPLWNYTLLRTQVPRGAGSRGWGERASAFPTMEEAPPAPTHWCSLPPLIKMQTFLCFRLDLHRLFYCGHQEAGRGLGGGLLHERPGPALAVQPLPVSQEEAGTQPEEAALWVKPAGWKDVAPQPQGVCSPH